MGVGGSLYYVGPDGPEVGVEVVDAGAVRAPAGQQAGAGWRADLCTHPGRPHSFVSLGAVSTSVSCLYRGGLSVSISLSLWLGPWLLASVSASLLSPPLIAMLLGRSHDRTRSDGRAKQTAAPALNRSFTGCWAGGRTSVSPPAGRSSWSEQASQPRAHRWPACAAVACASPGLRSRRPAVVRVRRWFGFAVARR